MKTCTQCGKSFSDDPRFCDNCGTLLMEESIHIADEPKVQPVQAAPAEEPVSPAPQPAPAAQPVPEAAPQPAPAVQPATIPQAAPAAYTAPPVQNSGQQVYYPKEDMRNKELRGDFRTAPTGINVMAIIGFVLAFLCVGFVWIAELSIVVFPVAIIALVLCTIVKAMKYDNIFAKIGFIVALVITIISGIIFGIYLYENVF